MVAAVQSMSSKLVSVFLVVTFLVALLSATVVSAEEPELIVAKNIMTRYPTANSEVLISLRIFNVGSGPAYDLVLDDRSWLERNFTADAGLMLATFEKLLPGQNITHNFIVIPSRASGYSTEPAVVKYRTSPKATNQIVTYSSTPGYGYMRVYRATEVPHRSLPHYYEWTVFVGLVAAGLALPALLYVSSRGQFQK